MGFQPVIVPVGRVGLGRIFNVVGAVVDPYMELTQSCQFYAGSQIDEPAMISASACPAMLDSTLDLVADADMKDVAAYNASGIGAVCTNASAEMAQGYAFYLAAFMANAGQVDWKFVKSNQRFARTSKVIVGRPRSDSRQDVHPLHGVIILRFGGY